MKRIFIALPLVTLFTGLFSACSSPPPVKPNSTNVEVSRAEPAKNCKEIGDVDGRVNTVKGTFEEALEDLRLDAARKGANYVQIKQTGAIGQSVRGTAYLCM